MGLKTVAIKNNQNKLLLKLDKIQTHGYNISKLSKHQTISIKQLFTAVISYITAVKRQQFFEVIFSYVIAISVGCMIIYAVHIIL